MLQCFGVANPAHFAMLSREALYKPLPTQALTMPPNEQKVLLFLLLQLFLAYCYAFQALK